MRDFEGTIDTQSHGTEFVYTPNDPEELKNLAAQYPEKVEEFNRGKKGLVGLFMGEVMKSSGGKIDPKAANRMIIEELNKRNKG